MPLNIVWQTNVVGEPTLLTVPLLGAGLRLTMFGDVVVDASWHMPTDENPVLSPFADSVQRYVLDPAGSLLHIKLLKQGTVFCHTVGNALLTIPVGHVWTYSFLAGTLGSGPRAVARACRDNPYAGIIPCHRVVAKSGIGGFMGATDGEFVALKRRLLDYEAALGRGG